MTRVEVVEPGRRYRVQPDQPEVADVFEFAAALIEQYGWHGGAGGTAPPSNQTDGYTLHDSIGEFGTRLSLGKDKEASMYDSHTGRSRTLRQEATALLMELINEGDAGFADDKAWENQPGRTQQQVIDLLERAKEEAIIRARGS